MTRAPDFFAVSQFRERYYRPDVIARVLDTLDTEAAIHAADEATGKPTAKAAPIASLTPVVKILDPADGSPQDRPELAVTYSARMPTPDRIDRLEARVDGAKIEAVDKELQTQGDTRLGILHVKLPRHDTTVSVIAYNANGASEPATIRVHWTGAKVDRKPTLYVLAIGISHYHDEHVQLHFAAKDADDFVALARAQEGGLYEHVITHTQAGSLRDDKATRDAILDELDWIRQAVTNDDIAMVFLSGHGMKTPDQHYHFLPYDYDPNRVQRTTITDTELQQYLTNIGGKTLFFFDTCYSAGVVGAKAADSQADVDKFANELRAAESGVVVFASSTGNQLSLEDPAWNNGAFAKAVVEGMSGSAARPGNAAISISDLNGYVSRQVKELTHGNQKPMMAAPRTVEDFWIAEVRN
jgi:hypothetical protein